MNEHLILPIMYGFESLDIKSHSYPNPIGMWPNEMECLVWSALNSPQRDWLEIGSFYGGSACLLGLSRDEANLGPTVFSCDIQFKPMVDINIINSEVGHLITKIECNSQSLGQREELEGHKLSLVFLDGHHAYNSVLQDVSAISKYLVDGAILGFHDVSDRTYKEDANEYFEFICPNKEEHQQLMSDFSENFRLDEAVATLLNTGNYELVDIPVRRYELHQKETGLSEFVRGTTSPLNSFCAIRKVK